MAVEIFFALIALVLLFWQASLLISAASGAPDVSAQKQAIESAFRLAGLNKNETVLDLGCSNAKSLIIAAEKFKARGIGVEISPFVFVRARLNIVRHHLRGKIKIRLGNLISNLPLVKKSDVVYLYLFPKILDQIEEALFSNLPRGARIVTLGFGFKNHQAKAKINTKNSSRVSTIFLYKI